MTETPAPALPVGPPEAWTMDERARMAQHRHHAVALRSLITASGQTPDEYLAGLSITHPAAAEQGAALLAYDDHLRARDKAAAQAKAGTVEDWQNRAATAEADRDEWRRKAEGKDALIDDLFRRMQARDRAHSAALRVARREAKEARQG